MPIVRGETRSKPKTRKLSGNTSPIPASVKKAIRTIEAYEKLSGNAKTTAIKSKTRKLSGNYSTRAR
jgi:hypothetical protein